MRLSFILAVTAILMACAPAPKAVDQPKPDLTREDWYRQTTAQLAAADREAEGLVKRGRFDEAADVILKGQPLQSRALLTAARPTLEAMEAAADLDDVYGRMLLRNQHYGWARSVFQKNVARWKVWKPQTPGTLDRLQKASAAVAECDRRLAE